MQRPANLHSGLEGPGRQLLRSSRHIGLSKEISLNVRSASAQDKTPKLQPRQYPLNSLSLCENPLFTMVLNRQLFPLAIAKFHPVLWTLWRYWGYVSPKLQDR